MEHLAAAPVFSRFLRYFMAAARLGSIRKASEALHISASAIDRQILLTEAALGVALFERLPSGLRLTAAGEILLAAAMGWQKDFATVRVQLDDLEGLRRGQVDIAVVDALSRGFVPRMIRQLREAHPFIQARLTVVDSGEVAGAILSGAVDFGLTLNPVSTRDLTVQAQAEIRLGLVSRTDHPVARQRQARFSACAEYPVVAPAPPLALCAQIRALEVATGVAMNTVASSDNVQMIRSLVLEGVGLSVLSWLDVAEDIRAGALAFTPIANAAAHGLVLALCVDRSRQLSAAARLLLGWMETALNDLVA